MTRSARWTPIFLVSGHSMAPTLRSGQLGLTRPRPARLRSGQIVVVTRPGSPRLVKRVAGLPGDLVELEAGRLRVNGESVDGRPRLPGATITSWQVPAGHYFLVGDNPGVSDDSRVWVEPFVPHEQIAGVLVGSR